jgi:hypothetical protein
MRKFLFWFAAGLITLGSAEYQRLTGPTYPVRGKAVLAGEAVKYELLRTEETTKDSEVVIEAPNPAIAGRLLYKRFKTEDPWTKVGLARSGNSLVGSLPKQPMAGKLAYRVLLSDGEKEVSLAGEDPIIIRFKGHVPEYVLTPHILTMFLAMFFSTVAGLAALTGRAGMRKYALWTVGLLFVGGFIFGPIVQKLAFGSLWTGVPFGFDLTDNKTLIAMLGWVVALIASRGGKPARGWILAASVLMLVVFLIPHSLFGSELRYADLTPPAPTG